MKSMTILMPSSISELGAEMSTKLKSSDISSRFVYYNDVVDIIETIRGGEISCFLFDSGIEASDMSLVLTEQGVEIPTIKFGVNTSLKSQSELTFKGQTKQDSLIANLTYAALMQVSSESENHYLPAKRLIVKDSGHIHVIKVEELAWVGGAGNYVELHMLNRQRSILHRDTMSAMEKNLKTYGFSRIHKSSLVNLNAITELKTRDNGDYDVILENGDLLHLSRRYRQNLAALLQVNS
ncbi:LytTR family DNA-binding domain-containing protein [Pseudoalteromonas sp. PS5]|uniref:LytR/AlgR family response regulator transcription factor n=1 Tax=Pseudoalteromonas sp. PS5 TaxID=1437473 RepID=UPI000FFF580D|nr:LytTR family DNA-binding domain-containing protein [Pseudoalteromonas sp. PS5]RXF02014.1 DNA-binding response regulator [Pseudoalteromonas sp. PS5]